MRQQYTMTQKQMDVLMDAMKAVPLIAIHISPGISPQERANDAWARLGKEMGFQVMTVRPVQGESQLFFTAEPVVAEG